MPSTSVETLDFAPTSAGLDDVLDAFEGLGSAGGGVRDGRARRGALATYARLATEPVRLPSRWRHDYARLDFDDLRWSSGRVAVPALPRVARAPEGDAPALAVENAGGLVHAGGVHLTSSAAASDARFTLLSLADATRTLGVRATGILGRVVRSDADRFVALATAFQNCGAYVEIASDATLDAPLQLLWMGRPGEAGAVFPQTVVRVGANARATILERHVGSSDAFVAGTVEIDLGPGAHLDYVVVQEAGDGARVAIRRAARVAARGEIAWHLAELGGALARGVVTTELREPGARARVHALSFASGYANADLEIAVDHRAGDGVSNVVVRRAAIDRGHGRFVGTIRIGPDGHGTDAALRDDALALSRDAYLDTVPTLEIAANDVSAAHGATVGSLDEEALFYVESRGIARADARRMIALAFFEPAISRFPSDALRDEIRTALDARLDAIPETFAS